MQYLSYTIVNKRKIITYRTFYERDVATRYIGNYKSEFRKLNTPGRTYYGLTTRMGETTSSTLIQQKIGKLVVAETTLSTVPEFETVKVFTFTGVGQKEDARSFSSTKLTKSSLISFETTQTGKNISFIKKTLNIETTTTFADKKGGLSTFIKYGELEIKYASLSEQIAYNTVYELNFLEKKYGIGLFSYQLPKFSDKEFKISFIKTDKFIRYAPDGSIKYIGIAPIPQYTRDASVDMKEVSTITLSSYFGPGKESIEFSYTETIENKNSKVTSGITINDPFQDGGLNIKTVKVTKQDLKDVIPSTYSSKATFKLTTTIFKNIHTYDYKWSASTLANTHYLLTVKVDTLKIKEPELEIFKNRYNWSEVPITQIYVENTYVAESLTGTIQTFDENGKEGKENVTFRAEGGITTSLNLGGLPLKEINDYLMFRKINFTKISTRNNLDIYQIQKEGVLLKNKAYQYIEQSLSNSSIGIDWSIYRKDSLRNPNRRRVGGQNILVGINNYSSIRPFINAPVTKKINTEIRKGTLNLENDEWNILWTYTTVSNNKVVRSSSIDKNKFKGNGSSYTNFRYHKVDDRAFLFAGGVSVGVYSRFIDEGAITRPKMPFANPYIFLGVNSLSAPWVGGYQYYPAIYSRTINKNEDRTQYYWLPEGIYFDPIKKEFKIWNSSTSFYIDSDNPEGLKDVGYVRNPLFLQGRFSNADLGNFTYWGGSTYNVVGGYYFDYQTDITSQYAGNSYDPFFKVFRNGGNWPPLFNNTNFDYLSPQAYQDVIAYQTNFTVIQRDPIADDPGIPAPDFYFT